jgi:hypothetical protein
MRIDRVTLYRIADSGSLAPGGASRRMRFRWNGEKREPQEGDWFLSGNPIGAYYMPNDGSEIPHYIAEIVPANETRCPTCGHER